MLATRINSPTTMTSVASLSVHWEFHNGILACGSHEVVLSPLEGRLLSVMMGAKGRVLTYGQLTEAMYGLDEPQDPAAAIKSVLKRLRPKLKDTPLAVENRCRWGYRVVEQDDSPRP